MAAQFPIPGYRLIDTISDQGGQAIVYRAEQLSIDRRQVAVKVYRSRLRTEQDRLGFLREVSAMRELVGHRNVVRLERADVTDGWAYIVMELCEGSLEDQVRTDGPLSAHQVSDIGVRVCGALAAAHDRGILHRDLKPSNLLWTAFGEVVVADFGIAALGAARPDAASDAEPETGDAEPDEDALPQTDEPQQEAPAAAPSNHTPVGTAVGDGGGAEPSADAESYGSPDQSRDPDDGPGTADGRGTPDGAGTTGGPDESDGGPDESGDPLAAPHDAAGHSRSGAESGDPTTGAGSVDTADANANATDMGAVDTADARAADASDTDTADTRDEGEVDAGDAGEADADAGTTGSGATPGTGIGTAGTDVSSGEADAAPGGLIPEPTPTPDAPPAPQSVPAPSVPAPAAPIVMVPALAALAAAPAHPAAGTPGYVAPELLAGGLPTVQSDVYALGATLYTLLYGTAPEPGERITDPLVPPSLAQAVTTAIATDPAQRFGSIAEVAEVLRPGEASTVVRQQTTPRQETVAAAVAAAGTLVEKAKARIAKLRIPPGRLAGLRWRSGKVASAPTSPPEPTKMRVGRASVPTPRSSGRSPVTIVDPTSPPPVDDLPEVWLDPADRTRPPLLRPSVVIPAPSDWLRQMGWWAFVATAASALPLVPLMARRHLWYVMGGCLAVLAVYPLLGRGNRLLSRLATILLSSAALSLAGLTAWLAIGWPHSVDRLHIPRSWAHRWEGVWADRWAAVGQWVDIGRRTGDSGWPHGGGHPLPAVLAGAAAATLIVAIVTRLLAAHQAAVVRRRRRQLAVACALAERANQAFESSGRAPSWLTRLLALPAMRLYRLGRGPFEYAAVCGSRVALFSVVHWHPGQYAALRTSPYVARNGRPYRQGGPDMCAVVTHGRRLRPALAIHHGPVAFVVIARSDGTGEGIQPVAATDLPGVCFATPETVTQLAGEYLAADPHHIDIPLTRRMLRLVNAL